MRLTWYGHSAFRVEFGDTALLIDPFLSDNPTWDGDWAGPSGGISHILLTHGHNDHFGDTLEIVKTTGAQVVGGFELCEWCAAQGAENVNPGGHGGTVDCGEFAVTFVNALHSSSITTSTGTSYMGNPLGLIVTPKDDKVLYHMGDTGIFGDMALINELYAPRIGLVPVGDRFTMGAREASLACKRFFQFDAIVPCHYGTFPQLDQTPDKFIAALGDLGGRVVVPERGIHVTL
ncbi:MAG: metal-dependent hydrolase [Pseudomonadota bacterium]